MSVIVFHCGVDLAAQPQDIAVKPGMSVYGWIGSNNVGLPGVVVSDGFEVTTTDANGVYYLPSQKRHGYVFISTPGNYEAPAVNNIPQFFKRLKASPNIAERADFILTPVDNDRHVVLVFGDTHFDYGNAFNSPVFVPDIMEQFEQCLADMNSVIDSYHAAGIRTYLLTVGDMTRESRWYLPDKPFNLNDYAKVMNRFNTVSFNVKGNHDNDQYSQGDWAGEQAWKDIIGPTYYSFNLGKVHYVVLDNVIWENNGACEGVVGDRSNKGTITDYQIEWLKKNLETVADKSAPLIISMHIPLYDRPNASNQADFAYMECGEGQQLVDCLDGFTNVLVLSGHTHLNSRYTPTEYPWLMSHQIAALGGNVWITGQKGWTQNNICPDGSPGGYGVYKIDGKDVQWYYKGVGFDKNYQFRTFDRNSINITAERYAPAANETFAAKVPALAEPYHTPSNDNEVLINVWGYDADWKVEVTEGAENLPVTRISAKDPLFMISNEIMGANKNMVPYANAVHTSTFFTVNAKSPTSTLYIKVTDRFGNVYTETMTRPKELTYDMR